MGRLWRLLIRLLIHYQGQEPDICNKRIIISNISIKYIAIRTSRYRVFRLVKFMLIEAEIGAPTVGEVEIEERKI